MSPASRLRGTSSGGRRLRVLAVIIAAAITSPAAAQERLAVLEFVTVSSGPNATPELLGGLSERARQAATREVGRGYIVMTEESTVAILRDMGRTCTGKPGECEIDTGRALGAALIITGSLRVIEGTYLLDLKLFDTANAQLLDGRSAEATKQLELLSRTTEAVRVLVRTGLRTRRGAGAPPPPSPGLAGPIKEKTDDLPPMLEEAVVAFESSPAGAIVRVDADLACHPTPCKASLTLGRHEAVVEKVRYAPAEVTVDVKRGAKVSVMLQPLFGVVEVETDPPGLQIALDGKAFGRSPISPAELDPGTYEVVIDEPCFHRTGERVFLKAGDHRKLRLDAKPRMAGLKVTAADAKGSAVEAKVRVGGRDLGDTGAVLRIPVCTRSVDVTTGAFTRAVPVSLVESKVVVVQARLDTPCAPGMVGFTGGAWPSGLGARVSVDRYCLDETEVTVGAYAACVSSRACSAPRDGVQVGGNGGRTRARATPAAAGSCNGLRPERAAHPVNCVSSEQASAYCRWAHKRLPTEHEWEWAARGAERGTLYPWGDADPSGQLCWAGRPRAPGDLGTCPVGSHPDGDSPEGVKDLAGNVWEWTSSPGSSSDERVVRGGGMLTSDPLRVSATLRTFAPASAYGPGVGFRCASAPIQGAP